MFCHVTYNDRLAGCEHATENALARRLPHVLDDDRRIAVGGGDAERDSPAIGSAIAPMSAPTARAMVWMINECSDARVGAVDERPHEGVELTLACQRDPEPLVGDLQLRGRFRNFADQAAARGRGQRVGPLRPFARQDDLAPGDRNRRPRGCEAPRRGPRKATCPHQ